MHVQTVYTCSPEDLEAAMSRVLAPLIERLNELEGQAGLRNRLFTVAQVAERTGYKADTVRKWIREGVYDRKGRLVFLKHKEITNGDYRVYPGELERFLSHF
ncbi:hypothetical protein [Spirosoma harenae]